MTPDYYNSMAIQPIQVMKAVMATEQLEGYLWGNIIKYAMRYSRKEDKKVTAEKIANYAKWLMEVSHDSRRKDCVSSNNTIKGN